LRRNVAADGATGPGWQPAALFFIHKYFL